MREVGGKGTPQIKTISGSGSSRATLGATATTMTHLLFLCGVPAGNRPER